jgi:catechol 2,3-dioxygenase-like lactoylglutathione lyase family enzyme
MGGPHVGWVAWVGVIADNLETERRFYRDVLGLKELAAIGDVVWFDMGWPNILEIKARSAAPGMERGYQIGFLVGDISVAHQDLIANGARPIEEIQGGKESGGYWCTFEDAEGNKFQIGQRLGPPWPVG